MGIIVCADIGGTQIRVAAFHKTDIKPCRLQRAPTQSSDKSPFEQLILLINSIIGQNELVEAIAVACPGPLNLETGMIIDAPNIPDWKNFPLKEKLSERFNVKVVIGNDANLAALGEWRYGAGQGHHDLIYLTISTGIGGGVIVGDRLLLGHTGLGAELGHITVLPEGPLCPCGKAGHLEALSSGLAIANYVGEQLVRGESSNLAPNPNLTAREVAHAANRGDKLAKAAFQRAGEFLGQAIADYLHIFNPSILIIGGGVSKSGALLLDPMKESLNSHVMDSKYTDNLIITSTMLGDEVGLIGALTLAQTKLAST